MSFLIDSIKKRFESEEDEEEGYDDMNYLVGNTSGLDVGQVPGPIDQRIGRMAQIGGEIMEIQIGNPSTFQIDRTEILNVIEGLDFDRITLHGDPNIGFTGAYATRGQGVTGYNIVHRYFKSYLEQMASFKYEADFRKEEMDKGFGVGYVNMHASNEQIPPREEQIASDKSLDPFGSRVTEINGDKQPNIYKNEKFMELLFDFLIKEKIERMELYQLYSQFFENYSKPFKDEWLKARNEKANEIYHKETDKFDDIEERITQKAEASSVAAQTDSSARQEYANKFNGIINGILGDVIQEAPDQDTELAFSNILKQLMVEERPFNHTPGKVESIKNYAGDELGSILSPQPNQDFKEDFVPVPEENAERAVEEIENLLDLLWERDSEEVEGFSFQGKYSALLNKYDQYDQRQLEMGAADLGDIEEKARDAFAGKKDMFEGGVYEDGQDPETPANLEILDAMVKQTAIGREMEKESTMFFNIIPAWMQVSESADDEDHSFEIPKFIWRNIVERKVDELDKDYDLKDFDQFQEFLDDERENELDVIAAVAACYVWGHFTQDPGKFEDQSFEQTIRKDEEYEMPELERESFTWVEWMDKFGLRVNLEAMYGDPGQLVRLWRPKDIAVVCHAINKEAEQMIDEYDENLVKFTIDMEHTASFGVDPWQELQKLIERERAMAEEEDEIESEPEKALAGIVKTYHLTKPGWEQQQGHRHGPFARGDETLYTWLYNLVDNGFARNEDEKAIIVFEVGGEYREEMYVIRVAMDMIQRGIEPEDLDPEKIPMDGEYENSKQALMARFFGLDKHQLASEMAKMEEHAFDPIQNLLEAEQFDYTYSSSSAIQNDNRPGEWPSEEYR